MEGLLLLYPFIEIEDLPRIISKEELDWLRKIDQIGISRAHKVVLRNATYGIIRQDIKKEKAE